MPEMRPQPARAAGNIPMLPEDPLGEGPGYDRGYSLWKPEPAALYLDLLRRRWGWIALCLFVSLAVTAVYIKRQTRIYSTSSLLLISPSTRGSSSSQSQFSDVIDEMEGGTGSETRSLQTEIEILRQSPIQDEAAKRLGLTGAESRPLDITVAQDGETNLVTITVNGPSPAIDRRMSNEIPQVYLEETRKYNQSSVSKARIFVQRQVGDKRTQLAEKEKELEDTKQRLHSPDVATQTLQLATAWTTFDTELRTAEVERSAAEAQLRVVHNDLPRAQQTILATESKTMNPLVPQFQAQLVTLESQRATLLKILQPNQPEVVSLDNQITDIQKRLKEEIKQSIISAQSSSPNPIRQALLEQSAQLQGAIRSQEARKIALTRAVSSLGAQINQLPMKERVLNSLQRDVLVLSNSYNQLNQKLQELRLDEEAKLANGRLLKPAGTPKTPIYPVKSKMIGTAVLMGLALGLLLIMWLESLDNTIRDPAQIEMALGLPILAGIPYMKGLSLQSSTKPGSVSSNGYYSSPLLEGAQSLQAAVTFNSPDTPIRSLMVVSPLPGEGKTTLSQQLAKVAAESGKKVILVDMDFRRPGLTREHGLNQKQGIANLVVQQAELDAVLVPTDTEGLFLLPTGPLPSNPVAFIQSQRFNEVLADLTNHCDLLLIDAPPLIMTDGLYLSRRVDGVILVVVPGTTTKGSIDRSVELLRRAQANIIGVCLNKVSRNNVSSYYGHYGYGYYGNYQYGYGPQEKGDGSPRKVIQPRISGSTRTSNGSSPRDKSDEA